MAIKIKVNRRIIPMIYAYTTPEIARHNGWIKIGYTDKQTVEERVKQQTHLPMWSSTKQKEQSHYTAV